jgi:hypothetical protein
MPSRKRQQEIRDNKKTDFGAILDKWEGSANGKKAEKPMKKSENKVNKSFAEIFSEYEKSASPKELKKEMADKAPQNVPASNPFFVHENVEDRRSASAAWSIYGNNGKVKSEAKSETKKAETKPVEIKKSEKYVATRDFSEILAEYADGKMKKTVSQPAKPGKTAEAKAEDKPASANPFFLEENEDDARSAAAVWSIYGNNKPVVREEKKPSLPRKKKSNLKSPYRKAGSMFQRRTLEQSLESMPRPNPKLNR